MKFREIKEIIIIIKKKEIRSCHRSHSGLLGFEQLLAIYRTSTIHEWSLLNSLRTKLSWRWELSEKYERDLALFSALHSAVLSSTDIEGFWVQRDLAPFLTPGSWYQDGPPKYGARSGFPFEKWYICLPEDFQYHSSRKEVTVEI